jgi:DNA-binding phage protein
MPESSVQALLAEIIAAGTAQGMQEKDIAAKAGKPQETLSRLKGRDDMRLSTLVRLAGAVGLRVALVPDDRYIADLERGELF